MSEWLKETDCKSVALHATLVRIQPGPFKHFFKHQFNYSEKPDIFRITMYKNIKSVKTDRIKTIRNLGILNKFRKGAKIIKIEPTKLLIKNRG